MLFDIVFFLALQSHVLSAQSASRSCDILGAVFDCLEQEHKGSFSSIQIGSYQTTRHEYHFHFLEMLIPLEESETIKTFSEFVDDSLFRWKLTEEMQPAIENCPKIGRFKVSTIKCGTYPKFSDEDYTYEIIKDDTVHYSPIGIFFSKIFRFHDCVLFVAKTVEGVPGIPSYYGHYFLLELDSGEWKVVRHKIIPM